MCLNYNPSQTQKYTIDKSSNYIYIYIYIYIYVQFDIPVHIPAYSQSATDYVFLQQYVYAEHVYFSLKIWTVGMLFCFSKLTDLIKMTVQTCTAIWFYLGEIKRP